MDNMAETNMITNPRFDKRPKFILTTYGPGSENSSVKVPDNFVAAIGVKIPKKISLQFPNGREIHIQFKHGVNMFTKLDPLYNELGGEKGFCLVMNYNGSGVFSVNVIDKEMTEIEYVACRRIARAPIIYQDKLGGKWWKFMAYVSGPIMLNGSINIIPQAVKICLRTGEEIKGTYRKAESRIYGFLPLLQKNYMESWDIMIFTYRGNGKFDLSIFDASRSEKTFAAEAVEIEIDSNSADGMAAGEDVERVLGPADMEEVADEEMLEFSRVLSRSNIDGSSHGVRIPAAVKPATRSWIGGEDVTVRNHADSWVVGIVSDRGGARFSRGWNKFCDDNKFVEHQTITFRLVEENEGIIFYFH